MLRMMQPIKRLKGIIIGETKIKKGQLRIFWGKICSCFFKLKINIQFFEGKVRLVKAVLNR